MGTSWGNLALVDIGASNIRLQTYFRPYNSSLNAIAVIDSTRMASAGDTGDIEIWNMATGELIDCITAHTGLIYFLTITIQ